MNFSVDVQDNQHEAQDEADGIPVWWQLLTAFKLKSETASYFNNYTNLLLQYFVPNYTLCAVHALTDRNIHYNNDLVPSKTSGY